jgi:serine/threonine protein phosphatase PrpC
MTVLGDNAVRKRIPLGTQSDVEVELSWHTLTHVGLRREVNQDSAVAQEPIFAVADGMGGHAAGEIASQSVVRRLAELGGAQHVTRADVESRLIAAIDDIAQSVGEDELGAGTTVTGVVLGEDPTEPNWTVFNIGDSRVYQLFKGALTQLTVDHSVVQHLIDTGQITELEAEIHPHANVITRAVGLGEVPTPDYATVAVIPGQRLLICSDGLSKELTYAGIAYYLAEAATAQEAAETLVAQALENAGRDNVTVVVIDVHAVGDVRDTVEIPLIDASP